MYDKFNFYYSPDGWDICRTDKKYTIIKIDTTEPVCIVVKNFTIPCTFAISKIIHSFAKKWAIKENIEMDYSMQDTLDNLCEERLKRFNNLYENIPRLQFYGDAFNCHPFSLSVVTSEYIFRICRIGREQCIVKMDICGEKYMIRNIADYVGGIPDNFEEYIRDYSRHLYEMINSLNNPNIKSAMMSAVNTQEGYH